MTGTNDASIFIGEETLIGVELAGNTVEVVESSGATDIFAMGGKSMPLMILRTCFHKRLSKERI